MASDVKCDRCGKSEMEHQGIERFCPFYSTFRARTPPPEDGPVVEVWVRFGNRGRVWMCREDPRTSGLGAANSIGRLWPEIATALDLTPGECRAYRLVPVREGVTDA